MTNQAAVEKGALGAQSVISQIWSECLASGEGDSLRDDIRSRLMDLLKNGSAPGKESLENALFLAPSEK